jgi:HKD family nuclease
MYYWNQVSENQTLKHELLAVKGVRKVQIATAFLSKEGVNLLVEMKQVYKLKKENITLYLSSEFSGDKPHEMLRKLFIFCNVKIIFDRTFHPKAYFIGGAENKLIFGSSNFTAGGMHRNVEFNFVGVPNEHDIAEENKFFDFCNRLAVDVNDDIINYYEENYPEIEKLKSAHKKLRAKLSGFKNKDDAFTFADYNIEDYYFTFEDYETFFIRNQKLSRSEIHKKRRSVQEKMLEIHTNIYPQIKKMGIACHKREDNITSLITPCVFNHHTVAWNGVRYGKHRKKLTNIILATLKRMLCMDFKNTDVCSIAL